jgi:hypothetical protein
VGVGGVCEDESLWVWVWVCKIETERERDRERGVRWRKIGRQRE